MVFLTWRRQILDPDVAPGSALFLPWVRKEEVEGSVPLSQSAQHGKRIKRPDVDLEQGVLAQKRCLFLD